MSANAGGAPAESPILAETTPDRPDVFISYAREQSAFVEGTLLRALVEDGKRVWIDLKSIPPAADWRDRIRDGILAARAFVVVISPATMASEACAEELGTALEAGKRVIPLLREEVRSSEVPEALERSNWILMREGDAFEAQYARLVEALETDLEWLDAHARLTVRAGEWERGGRDRSRLLRGQDLRATEDFLAKQGSHRESATAEQTAYIVASRQAASRRWRITLAAVVTALIVSLALGALALVQRNRAVDNQNTALSRLLADGAEEELNRNASNAALISLEAMRLKSTFEARSAMLAAVPRLVNQVGELPGHDGLVQSVAFSSDGETLASGGFDGAVRLWDPDARIARGAPLTANHGEVQDLAFSPDGEVFATTGSDDTVQLWDAASGSSVGAPLEGHTNDVMAVAFSPDGDRLASADFDGNVRMWDVDTGGAVGRPVSSEGGSIFGVAFSPDGEMLAAAGAAGVERWDAETGRSLGEPFGGSGIVFTLAFSPDGETLASGGEDKDVRLWDPNSGRPRGRALSGHTGAVNSVAFGPDGATLASASGDGTVRLWDVRSGRPLGLPLMGHTEQVETLAFSPDGQTLASGGFEGTVRLWDVGPGEAPVRAVAGPAAAPYALAFSIGGDVLAAAEPGERASRLNLDTDRPLGDPGARRAALATSIEFSPDGKTVAFGQGLFGTVRVWDADTGEAPARLRGNRVVETVDDLAFSADGETLASAGDAVEGTVRLWDVGSRMAIGKPLTGHAGSVSAVALNPDGDTVASGGFDGTVRLWDVETGTALGRPLRGHNGIVNALAFSPDGETLASAGGPGDMTVRLWDVTSASIRGDALAGHRSSVDALAFSPDGQVVASGDSDGNLRLWDSEAVRAIGSALEGEEGIHALEFSPDGRSLASGDTAGTVRVWDSVFWVARAPILEAICVPRSVTV